MCDFFPGCDRQDVQITYTATGLGYQTRPGGAVPTIIVEIRPGLPFQFFFLERTFGFCQHRHSVDAQHGDGRRPG